jgi:NAD+ kinase
VSRRVLVVAKRAQFAHFDDAERRRLTAAGVVEEAALAASHHTHEAALRTVLAVLADDDPICRRADELVPADTRDIDLAVAVGGDGTVFATAKLIGTTPLIAVNSDPARSVGSYTRCTAAAFAGCYAAWRHGTAAIDTLPRLGVAIDGGGPHHFLNDCLFTNANPAAVTRYVLVADDRRESHRSSGVWVSTAAGATAAIRNAGFPASLLPDRKGPPALLFLVREPLRHPSTSLLVGCQQPIRGLTLIAGCHHLHLYHDGSHTAQAVPIGARVDFTTADLPLRLVLPPP